MSSMGFSPSWPRTPRPHPLFLFLILIHAILRFRRFEAEMSWEDDPWGWTFRHNLPNSPPPQPGCVEATEGFLFSAGKLPHRVFFLHSLLT